MPDWLKLVYEKYGVPFPLISYIVVFVAAGVIAALVWNIVGAQYEKDRPKTPGEVDHPQSAPSQSELGLNIVGANVYERMEAGKPIGNTGVTLTALVWNNGKPSFAIDWSLHVEPAGKTRVRGQWIPIPADGLRLDGIDRRFIPASDALDEKTKSNAIGKEPVRGRLSFFVPLPKQAMSDPNTVFELTVRDTYGSEAKKRVTLAMLLSARAILPQ